MATQAPQQLTGADAFATSVSISRAGWASAPRVVVGSATAWPDLLAASSLGVPILLTATHALPAVVAEEIDRLDPSEAVIVGGIEAIGQAVRDRLRGMALRLVELSGTDRYDTAARVAGLLPPTGDAIVVSGEAYADAVAIAPWAAARRVPMYLTTRDTLPAASHRVGQAQRTIVVGGPAVVSPAVAAGLPNPLRLHGLDRFETSAAVAQWSIGDGLAGGSPMLVPSASPAEAVAGGVLAGLRRSPVLLAPEGRLPVWPQIFLARVAGSVTSLTSVGEQVGEAARSDALSATRSADLVEWVNAARARAGLAPLVRDTGLDERAIGQTVAMMGQRRLFHQAPACGTWGEAVGNGDASAVFDAWMASPSHRAVILGPGVAKAGTAVLTAADGLSWVTLVACG